ncbi:MAG: methionyl-tRNA formyltransferase [Weeksellaceae bacterium]
MKIVFMGTPEFAAICLEEILKSQHEVAAVVSVPDKPAGRGQKLHQSAVSKMAIENNLKLLQPEKLKSQEFIDALIAIEADAFVVVAFRMLPKAVWEIPKAGTFNLHASLLPQYRGAAPINWAIINGETETGVTTFLIDEKIDTGNILLKEKVRILPEDDAGTLHDKLAEVGKKLIIATLDGLKDNTIIPKPQEAISHPKPAPKIFKEDCRINWTAQIENIHNKIRGLSPYPAAWTVLNDNGESKVIKIFKGHFDETPNPDAAQIPLEFTDSHLKIMLPQGNYYIEELQPEGKKRMNARDFINGIRNKNGWKVD